MITWKNLGRWLRSHERSMKEAKQGEQVHKSRGVVGYSIFESGGVILPRASTYDHFTQLSAPPVYSTPEEITDFCVGRAALLVAVRKRRWGIGCKNKIEILYSFVSSPGSDR